MSQIHVAVGDPECDSMPAFAALLDPPAAKVVDVRRARCPPRWTRRQRVTFQPSEGIRGSTALRPWTSHRRLEPRAEHSPQVVGAQSCLLDRVPRRIESLHPKRHPEVTVTARRDPRRRPPSVPSSYDTHTFALVTRGTRSPSWCRAITSKNCRCRTDTWLSSDVSTA